MGAWKEAKKKVEEIIKKEVDDPRKAGKEGRN
jgi:hypothetical protein